MDKASKKTNDDDATRAPEPSCRRTVTARRLFRTLTRHWPALLLGGISTVILSLSDAGFTWLIKPIIDRGFVGRDRLFIRWLPLIVLLIFVVRAVTGFASSYFVRGVSRKVVMHFRRLLYAHLLYLPAAFHDGHDSGQLLSTLIYNVERVEQATSNALLTCLREVSLMAGLLAVMFVSSWQLALTFLIITPAIAGVVRLCSRRLRTLSARVQESVGDVAAAAKDGIQGYRVVRASGAERQEAKKFERITAASLRREQRVITTESLSTAAIQLLIVIPICLTLYLATLPSLQISAGGFAAALAAMIVLLRPVRRLSALNSEVQQGLAAAASVFRLLDSPPEQETGTRSTQRARGGVDFEDIVFAYAGAEREVLSGLSLHVDPGETVALIGKSGCGKTTLIHLLLRFYAPQAGRILLDGIPVADLRLADYRRQFALVSQHTTLFNDTIGGNIAYGMEDVSEDRILAAAEHAYAMDFIERLPHGLQTPIGENGIRLSAGERQRVAIARAVLRDAPILVLDEATSALDAQSETAVQAALSDLMKGRTTLVVTHRTSTLEHADTAFQLEAGRLVGIPC